MEEKKDVQQIEWFDDRYYKVLIEKVGMEKLQETFFPSVTTILGIINKPFLSRWRGDVGNWEADRKMNYAAWRGSRIHDGISKLLLPRDDGKRTLGMTEGKEGPFRQDEWLNILRFVQWFNLFKPEVLWSEYIVASKTKEYAGTTDLIVRLKAGEYQTGPRTKVTIPVDGTYIGDIKTGKSVDDDYHFQTAAYAHAYMEEPEAEPIIGTFLLHLGAENSLGWKMHLRNPEEMFDDLACFNAAHIVWKRKNPNASPTVFTMPTTITLE